MTTLTMAKDLLSDCQALETRLQVMHAENSPAWCVSGVFKNELTRSMTVAGSIREGQGSNLIALSQHHTRDPNQANTAVRKTIVVCKLQANKN